MEGTLELAYQITNLHAKKYLAAICDTDEFLPTISKFPPSIPIRDRFVRALRGFWGLHTKPKSTTSFTLAELNLRYSLSPQRLSQIIHASGMILSCVQWQPKTKKGKGRKTLLVPAYLLPRLEEEIAAHSWKAQNVPRATHNPRLSHLYPDNKSLQSA